MDPYFSKCGTNCASCPSYKDNLLTDDDRRSCSQGWHTYHGFRLSPEKLISCDGCQPISGNGSRYINCIIRRCALHNQVNTCAHCSAYPCDVLTGRVFGQEWLDRLVGKLGEIPEEDYEVFVEPYLALRHLDDIRAMLEPGLIKDVKVVALQYRLAAFPVELESAAGFKDLYLLLQDLNTPVDGLSYAQAETQKERQRHLLKILWAFGLFGEFDPDRKALTLDHKIYLAQKIHSSYDRVQDYFETLDGYGVHCEIVLPVESRSLTPTGALRRQGIRENSPPWEMKMTVDESIGGVPLINALQRYASDLDAAFGKTAYRKFARADMQIRTD